MAAHASRIGCPHAASQHFAYMITRAKRAEEGAVEKSSWIKEQREQRKEMGKRAVETLSARAEISNWSHVGATQPWHAHKIGCQLSSLPEFTIFWPISINGRPRFMQIGGFSSQPLIPQLQFPPPPCYLVMRVK